MQIFWRHFFVLFVIAGLSAALPYSAMLHAADSDGDGLCDVQKEIGDNCITGPGGVDPEPDNADADNDGVCDGPRNVLQTQSFPGCVAAPRSADNPDGDDSDGDGVADGDELGDADSDGVLDYLDPDSQPLSDGSYRTGGGDSDNDGISDRLECANNRPCLNSDRDSIPDYLDPDSDGDGLSDDLEADHLYQNIQLLADSSVLDTDGDGIADFRDSDSDNDGICDGNSVQNRQAVCSGDESDDIDQDGIFDAYDPDSLADNSLNNGGDGGDSDNDGLSDFGECGALYPDCPDGDNDGLVDYLDNNLDSDDDGINDADEDRNLDGDLNPATGITDTDGDGTADYLDIDADNDGVQDRFEHNFPYRADNPRDRDRDGIADFVDADSETQDGSGGDSDNDGVSDRLECDNWPQCPDADNDGSPDYADADSQPAPQSPGQVSAGVDGVGGFSTFLSLMLLAGAFFSSLLSAGVRAESARVENKGESEGKSWQQNWQHRWSQSSVYLGGGSGVSSLQPDTSASAYQRDDDSQIAYKLLAGWDLNPHWSVEGYYANLGRVELNSQLDTSPDGSISYSVFGSQLLYQRWLLGGERLPGSLALGVNAGLNHLQNSARSIDLQQDNAWQLKAGVQTEYYLTGQFSGYSVRLDWESYDSDASLVSVSIVRRFAPDYEVVYFPDQPQQQNAPKRKRTAIIHADDE